MKEVDRTNNFALISFIEALLADAGVAYFVADAHASAAEGSIGALPRRILVDATAEETARRLLTDAGLGAELRPKK